MSYVVNIGVYVILSGPVLSGSEHRTNEKRGRRRQKKKPGAWGWDVRGELADEEKEAK